MAQANADDFAARLALALKALNLSRSQLSSLVGAHKSLVSRWLNGQVEPAGNNLARISAEFAKLRPGFNMTLWTAPRPEFEAALGLVSGAALQMSTVPWPPPAVEWRRWVPLVGAGIVLALLLVGTFLWRGLGQPFAERPASRSIESVKTSPASVAVMPFVNMSGDPEKEYLGDGISEEILNDLANVKHLRVAARTSSFSFKGKNVDIKEIARELNVHAVLEGSVREQQGRIRIVAQLIDAADGFHLWSASYDRNTNDILAVQHEIARAIVATMTLKLIPGRKSPQSIDPFSYQEFLQAQYFFNQRTDTGAFRADKLLADAISRQPDFVAALALRSHVLLLTAGGDQRILSESKLLTAEALRLDPENQEALNTELQRALRAWDWETAARDAKRFLGIRKHTVLTENGLAFFYNYMGFPELALKHRREAALLNPLSLPDQLNYAETLEHVGHVRGAIAANKKALELQPAVPWALLNLCTLYAQTGAVGEARAYAAQLAVAPPQYRGLVNPCQFEIAASEKDTSKLRAIVDRMNSPEVKSYASNIGMLYVRAGDMAAAMRQFSRAYDMRDQRMIWHRYDATTPKALLQNAQWQALWQRPLLADWQRRHDRIAAAFAHNKGEYLRAQ